LNEKMALRLIAAVMDWPEEDDGTATREYAWLRLMSRVKYDGYSDFRAGVHFLESFATWLKQFDKADRPIAYNFIKTRLVYVSPPELQCLVETFLPEVVTPRLRLGVAEQLGVKPYEVWRTSNGARAFDSRLRRTLFVGMSDGSRIDVLRRANSGRLSTEQVLPMLNVDIEKWHDLGKNLIQEEGQGAKFDNVYLIDDFSASGTTFIRFADDTWKGKLKKFDEIVTVARKYLKDDFPIIPNYTLHVHHYISSFRAQRVLRERLTQATEQWKERSFGECFVTEGLLLPSSLELSLPGDEDILDLCERYYDHALFERLRRHCEQAGQTSMQLGYADCALPIVLDHNTPNNSIPLLWAETAGGNGFPAMRPLFLRRDRHG
jgi:hypothetical protein